VENVDKVCVKCGYNKLIKNNMPQRTYTPKKRRHLKVHGFLAHMATKGGRKTLSRRRAKGRRKLTVSHK
jgi:large subunit ribosomal protein L34